MNRTKSWTLAIAATSLLVVVLVFQNCGRYTAGLESNSEINGRTGTLDIEVFDSIGAREQLVPVDDSLVSAVEYRVVVKAASAWEVNSIPSASCRLEVIDGFANERTLSCSKPAQISLTVKDGAMAEVTLTKTVLSNTALSSAGSALYTANCVSCHGVAPDARVKSASALKIDEAFTKYAAMASLASLSPTSIRALGAFVGAVKTDPGGSTPTPTPTSTPTPSSTPMPTDPGGVSGASLYAKNCLACHGALDSSAKRGASAALIMAAINGKVAEMAGLKNLTSEEVEAISQALGAPTAVAAISPGFRYLMDRFEVFKTEAGTAKADATVDNLLKRTITSGMEFMGGTCSKYQDPELCNIKYTDYYIRTGAEENPSVSSIRRGYITRACEEIVSTGDLLKTALARRGLTEMSAFTDANLASAFQAFVPGRKPTPEVLAALRGLGSSAQVKGKSPLIGWQFVFHSICISSAADLL